MLTGFISRIQLQPQRTWLCYSAESQLIFIGGYFRDYNKNNNHHHHIQLLDTTSHFNWLNAKLIYSSFEQIEKVISKNGNFDVDLIS